MDKIELQRASLLLPLVQGYREMLWWEGSDLLSKRIRGKLAFRLPGIEALVAKDRDIEAMEPQEPKEKDWEKWKASLSAAALASLTTWSGQTYELGLNYVNAIAAKTVNKSMTQKTLLFHQFWVHYRKLP